MAEKINEYQARKIRSLREELRKVCSDLAFQVNWSEGLNSTIDQLRAQLHSANNELCVKANQLDELKVVAEEALKRLDSLEKGSAKLVKDLELEIQRKDLENRVNSQIAEAVCKAQAKLFMILAESINKK